MTAPSPHTHPAERETPAGEAMREAVAQIIGEDYAVASRGAPSHSEHCADLVCALIASEFARLTAERDEARADKQVAETQNEALHVKLRALAPHGSCACSYDQPGDVCSHHSPALAAAEAALTTLRADHAAEVARLKGALKLAENPLSYRHATDPSGPGSAAVASALDAVRAALATTETTDA